MALESQIVLRLVGQETTTADFSSPSDRVDRSYDTVYGNGTGANQADMWFHDKRTINASSNDDLDLAGVLTSKFGATLTFAKVKAILIKAAAGNTNNVVVGNAAATQFVGPFGAAAHTLAISPGGVFVITFPGAAGWAVAGGSADILRIANSGGGTSVEYDLFILGTSA